MSAAAAAAATLKDFCYRKCNITTCAALRDIALV